ncbi:MAG: hypothetical protein KIS87_04895 [Phycisphaeraceae bacterium]|nr:hypothetical protein [Phycisphaeraceae bacterium]
MTMRPRHPEICALRHAALLSAAILLCAAGLAAGCASKGRPSATQAASDGQRTSGAAEARLRSLAASQERQPNRRAASLGPPPGIDPLVLMPIDRDSEAWRRARLSHEDAVREAAASARPIESVEPSARRQDSTDALRLYASGRQRLLDGDAVGAVRDLERASILDPGSAEVWRTLGAAQSAAGQASGAMASMRRAVALGLVDAQAFASLGRHALRLGDDADAVAMLARALASNPNESDPALRTVVLIDLADALHEQGYLTASAEAVRRAIEQPERISGSTAYRAELGAIVRRAGELWRRVGDDACRLGDFDRALSAYRRAAASPALDPGAVAPRCVYASLRLGRSAEAALAILDEIRHETGRTDPRLVGLVRHVASAGDAEARLLAEAVDEQLRTLGVDAPASLAARLVRAKAAALPPAEARRALREHLAARPTDADALDDLLRLASASGLRAAAEETVTLAGRHPIEADEFAAGLLTVAPSAGAAIGAVDGRGAGALVRAFLLIGASRPDEAVDAVSGGTPRGVVPEGWAFAQVAAAAAAGRWDEAERSLRSLEAPETREQRHAQVRSLRAMQRFAAALREVEPLLGPEAGVDMLIRGSELYLGFGRAAEAEALLGRAHTLDRYDERVYEGLLSLYQQGSPLENPQRQAAIARELRETIPSSRLLRWLAAQELAQRGLLDEAERALLDLASEGRGTERAVELLVQVWDAVAQREGPDALEEAEAWVRGRVAERPGNAVLNAALARVLLARGKVDEGVAYLAERRDLSPNLARLHEQVLRSVLGRTDEANGLALTRLFAAPPTIDNSLELAGVLAQSGMFAEAVEPVARAIPAGVTLTARQKSSLMAVLAMVGEAATTGRDADAARAGLAMMDSVLSRGIDLPWPFHRARWGMMDDVPGVPEHAFAAAAIALVEAAPDVESIQELVGPPRDGAPAWTLDTARAELAYMLASTLWSTGREEASLVVYRAALRYNPEHAWSSNDLGYFLVERGEDMAEAERLLEQAYRLRPDEASIVDSLGWLRYRQGRFEDWQDERGTRHEGAISLLRRATQLPSGVENQTLHDHLGDALWAAGRKQEAISAWQRADRWATVALTRLVGQPDSPRAARLKEQHARITAKLRAAREGGEPEIAPLFESPGGGG